MDKKNEANETTMSKEALEARREYKREYMRKWRAEHRDNVRRNNAAYWQKKADEKKNNG